MLNKSTKEVAILNPKFHYHTHPGDGINGGLDVPSLADINHLKSTENIPHIILGGRGGISRSTLENGNINTQHGTR